MKNQLLEAAERYRRMDEQARAAITEGHALQGKLRAMRSRIDHKTPLFWVAVIVVPAVVIALLLLQHYAG